MESFSYKLQLHHIGCWKWIQKIQIFLFKDRSLVLGPLRSAHTCQRSASNPIGRWNHFPKIFSYFAFYRRLKRYSKMQIFDLKNIYITMIWSTEVSPHFGCRETNKTSMSVLIGSVRPYCIIFGFGWGLCQGDRVTYLPSLLYNVIVSYRKFFPQAFRILRACGQSVRWPQWTQY